jgi:phospholipid/cholesterol/gamma-HCH transport system substrate-binding protein
MAKKTSAVKLGVFIFIGIVFFVIGIFLIGDKEALFRSTFNVKAYFKDIQGLRSGSTVRLSGIDVGAVDEVRIINDTTGRVEVTMSLVEDIKRFIRTDTKASIETEGLVGNKVIVLEIGSSSSDPVGEGGTIQSKEPVSFAAVIEETQGIMKYTKEITRDLSEIVARVNRGEGSIGKLLVDEELYSNATQLTRRADQSLMAITDELKGLTDLFNDLGSGVQRVVGNVDSVIADIDVIVKGVKNGKGLIGSMFVDGNDIDSAVTSTIRNIERTSADARLAASRLAENMEALKHNWLFKSYFEERGYWDKAEYEDYFDGVINELNEKIKTLDEKIETLRSLEDKTSKK